MFLDYEKTFEWVWRGGLWHKLVKENVTGKILNVFTNMHKNIQFCVTLNQQLSDNFVREMVVRQGENLSPLLFALYLNDIEGKLLECNCDYLDFGEEWINCYLKVVVLLYAADTVVVCDSEEGMRQASSALCTYCNEW